MSSIASKFLPSREKTTTTNTTNTTSTSTTSAADDDEALGGEDVSEVTKLLFERLQAWKHACGYIEEYIGGCEKMHLAQAKELEKMNKTVSNPLREGHHFDQQVGGVSEMFDGIRSNTMNVAASHNEIAKQLKAVVLPVFERLHAEIKGKQKEIQKGVGKSSKTVDKARGTTQRHIEQLGQHTATLDASGGAQRVPAERDPFVERKLVTHRLHKQVQEENATRQDTLQVQSTFSQFESHVLQTLQQGMQQFVQTVSGQLDGEKPLWANMAAISARIDPLFEWNGFVKRNDGVLIDPQGAPRDASQISFPNQEHQATRAMIQGSLERKGHLLRKFEAGFCAVTPARYLHEFKSDDEISKEPTPTLSLYLPDCQMGGINGAEFTVKGKNAAGNKVAGAVAQSQSYTFRAHTASDAQKWYRIIEEQAGSVAATSPVSPIAATDTGKEKEFASLNAETTDSSAQTSSVEKDSGATAVPEKAEPSTTATVAEKVEASSTEVVAEQAKE